MKKSTNRGCSIAIAILTLIATLITIFTFSTGMLSIPQILERFSNKSSSNADTPSPKTTPAPVDALENSQTNTPYPTKTPVLEQPKPTEIIPTITKLPTATQVPTEIPNTPAGSILQVSQSWRQDNVLLTLERVDYNFDTYFDCRIGFSFTVDNLSSSSIIVTIDRSQYSLEDNLGNQWQMTGFRGASRCTNHFFESASAQIEPGKHWDYGLYHSWNVGFTGNLADPAIDYVIITVNNLYHFNGAKWKIPINN
jgi:hypothetical protein